MRIVPFAAFFLSGASSLIFQMIWSRQLHHVFGSSSVAISSVVSVFMAGLALGAWLFGRRADRIARPLLVYAWVELGVGLCALAVPALTRPQGWLASVNALLRQQFGPESLELSMLRFLCIVPILIVPTTLMGSTLPLLARHFVAREQDSGTTSARVGALYAINTAGAVAGVFLGGFVLIPGLGVSTANLVAVLMNFTLALGIFGLRRVLEAQRAEANADLQARSSAQDAGRFPRPVRLAAAVTFGLSGLCSLAYEVVWSRALVNTIGASVYAFALILMTFLIGIAGGSALASLLMRGGRQLPSGLLAFAGALSVVALAPAGIRDGALPWLLSTCAAVAALLVARSAGLRKAAELATLGDTAAGEAARARTAALLHLVPALCALGVAAYYRTRLEYLIVSLVLATAALSLLLLLLRGRVVVLLACVQFYIGLSTLTADFWADEISLTFASMVAPLYDALAEHVDRVMALMFASAALCVLPSALGMGATFPLTMRVFGGGGEEVGREVSVVYAGNTVGSIAGAWLPGFVLMPWIGMQATLHAGIALNLALGLFVCLIGSAARTGEGRPLVPRRGAQLAAALVPVLIALLAVSSAGRLPFANPLTWNLSKMTLGVFRISLAKDVLDEEAWGEPDLVYYKDGLSTTVSVERWGRHYSLKNNGKVEASNGDDMPTQIMVSALPLLLHRRGPQDLDVAIIGLGSGVTVGAALQFPVRSVEVVELERAVAEASRFFASVNHLQYELDDYPYIRMPRLRLINDDGRNYLASGSKLYDVIVSEPSNPWITGVSDLFTIEHFRISKRRLAPGGVYCQWVQLYELSPENVKIIYRTFASQFEHVMVFSAEDLSSDTILVGSDSPLVLDLPRVRRTMALPRVEHELERAYVHAPFDVFSRVLLSSRQEVMQYTQHEQRLRHGTWISDPASTNRTPCPAGSCRRRPAPLNTDDNALIEFAAPRDLIGFERYKGYLQTVYSASWPYGSLLPILRGFGEGAVAAGEYSRQALSLLAHGRKREAASMLALAEAAGDSQTDDSQTDDSAREALRLARRLVEALGPAPDPPPLRIEPPPIDPRLGEPSQRRLQAGYAAAMRALERDDHEAALHAIKRIPGTLLRHAGPELRFLRAYLDYRGGEHSDAVGELESIARLEPEFVLRHPELYFYLGRAHDALQHFDKAVRNLRVYFEATALTPAPEAHIDTSGAPTTDLPGETLKLTRALTQPQDELENVR